MPKKAFCTVDRELLHQRSTVCATMQDAVRTCGTDIGHHSGMTGVTGEALLVFANLGAARDVAAR